MNIHRRMKKNKFIGCLILLGLIMGGCQNVQQINGENVVLDETLGEEKIEEPTAPVASEEETLTEESAQEQVTWENYPWEMKPGQLTMENYLVTAFSPVGQTMYIWGGGWNEEDTGAGVDATTLGLSPVWAEFASKQTAEYDYHDYKYEIHKGLDCSGYVGWLIYNLMETEDGKDGYVMKSSLMAEEFAKKGWGTYTPAEKVSDWQLGDIMSMKGHVWISLGTMEDGSVLILHSSVVGVIVCGTSLPEGEDSQAVRLARQFMSTCYPDWYEKFPDCSRPYSYLSGSGQFRWDENVLQDEWDLKGYSAEDMMLSLQKKLLAK